jgi:hypothetical protein
MAAMGGLFFYCLWLIIKGNGARVGHREGSDDGGLRLTLRESEISICPRRRPLSRPGATVHVLALSEDVPNFHRD